jgi:hypothetical protein
MELLRQNPQIIGLAAMVLVIAGTFAPAGSIVQRMLFLFPAIVLVYVAYVGHQKMLLALQVTVTLGALLAFMDQVPSVVRYFLLTGGSVAAVAYLLRIGHVKDDAWWPIGGLGMVLLSMGYSTDAMSQPILFNSLLCLGGMLVAVYSSISYFRDRVKIAFIWMFLNIVFVVKPLVVVISLGI